MTQLDPLTELEERIGDVPRSTVGTAIRVVLVLRRENRLRGLGGRSVEVLLL